MSSWVKFINKTKYPAVYVSIRERYAPVLVIDQSKYLLASGSCVNMTVYDNRGHISHSIRLSLKPAKLNIVVLK